ncbi:MAG: hypothetical protein ACTSRT_18225 [Promethearchaeota archaeon]
MDVSRSRDLQEAIKELSKISYKAITILEKCQYLILKTKQLL